MRTEPDDFPLTISSWLAQHTEVACRVSDSGRNDLRVLLAHHLGRSTGWVAAHTDTAIPESTREVLESDLNTYLRGVPLPYLLEKAPFFGREFIVSPAVMIPRPETEMLVEQAVAWLSDHPDTFLTMDVGTGSGCIPISLALANPAIQCIAVDISPAALRIASKNRAVYRLQNRVQLVRSNLLSGLRVPLPVLVTANLPYIPAPELDTLAVARHEPTLALNGGTDGMYLIRRLLHQIRVKINRARRSYKADSDSSTHREYCLLFEIEYRQGEILAAEAKSLFPEARIEILPDLSGLPRVLVITCMV